MMTQGAIVLPVVTRGMTKPSAMRKPSTAATHEYWPDDPGRFRGAEELALEALQIGCIEAIVAPPEERRARSCVAPEWDGFAVFPGATREHKVILQVASDALKVLHN